METHDCIRIKKRKILKKLGLKQSKTDPCLFYKHDSNGDLAMLLIIHVDDTLVSGRESVVNKYLEDLQKEFKIEILGELRKHLGVWYEWKVDGDGEIYLEASMPEMIDQIDRTFQEAIGRPAKKALTPGYPGQMLKENKGEVVKIDEYRSLTGQILYYMVKIGPELANAARDLSTHMSNPGEEHWKSMERCVGFITNNRDDKLVIRSPKNLETEHFFDSDFAKSEDDRKSISGRISLLGKTLISWASKKQRTVALSSCQAELNAFSEGCQESEFMRSLLYELFGKWHTAIVHCDNQGTIFLTKNQQVSSRTKHIQIREFWIRDLQESGAIDTKFCRSENNYSDICTKNVSLKTFTRHAKALKQGLMSSWREDVKISRGAEESNDSYDVTLAINHDRVLSVQQDKHVHASPKDEKHVHASLSNDPQECTRARRQDAYSKSHAAMPMYLEEKSSKPLEDLLVKEITPCVASTSTQESLRRNHMTSLMEGSMCSEVNPSYKIEHTPDMECSFRAKSAKATYETSMSASMSRPN